MGRAARHKNMSNHTQEEEAPILESAWGEFLTVFRWVLFGIVEAFFLACWVLTQYVVNEYVISRFEVNGIDAIVLTIAQWLFGIATLAPILFRIIKLLGTLSIRTYRAIRDEWRQVG